MATLAERIASFDVAYPANKKRTSSAKGAKNLQWPHKNPSPARLAQAGFIYRPTSSAPDNATCFLCQANLDGWEPDDNPAAEHLKLSPHCGWAINIAIEQNLEDAIKEAEGPTSESMSQSRKMTFESRWPHENKRGWICKSQKMADSGWYHCPTEESDDFVRCAYCGLGLDGWEPKDNPYDEHQRRSGECVFFSQPLPKAKPGRGRKARASKVSRLSNQSNFTAFAEDESLALSVAINNNSVMVLDDDLVKLEKGVKGPKKGTKAKKSNAKLRGKAARAGVEESMQASSFVEPEDDDFDVKVAPEKEKPTRGRKRKSEHIEEDVDVATKLLGAPLEPPAKKRATRTRASSVQPEDRNDILEQASFNDDTQMTNLESMPPPSMPKSRKGGKGGRKRGSSTVRKASATSTASMASLRAVAPDDSVIEAALEADLDRPLTDEEADAKSPPRELTKTRRLTRTKPAPGRGPASIAPTRRTTRTNAVEFTTEEVWEPDQVSGTETALEPKPEITIAKKSRKVTRKMTDPSKSVSESGDQEVTSAAGEHMDREPKEGVAVEPKGRTSRQVFRQAPARKTRASEISTAPNVEYPTLDPTSSAPNSSILGPIATADDSGHETDASVASQRPKKRASKKGGGKGKKVKVGKKNGIMSRNIEDIVQPDVAAAVIIEQPPRLDAVSVEEPEQITEEQTVNAAALKKGNKKKTTKSAKAKTTKTKAVIVPSSPPASQMSEPWTDQPLDESTPLHISRADIPTFTPVEAAQIAPPPQAAATPPKETLRQPSPRQETPRPAVSPQSSDAENQPPSSRPSALRPPLEMQSPSKSQTMRVPLAASTPTASPSRRNISRLQTSMPWTAVAIDKFLLASPNVDKENIAEALKGELTSPEKKFTVEEWIFHNARKGEEKLRNECERLVGRFEGEGVRALKTLEGIVVAEA